MPTVEPNEPNASNHEEMAHSNPTNLYVIRSEHFAPTADIYPFLKLLATIVKRAAITPDEIDIDANKGDNQ